MYDRDIAASTELFFYPEIWYPEGYKVTQAEADNGKTLLGMTYSFVNDHPHYLQWACFDDF